MNLKTRLDGRSEKNSSFKIKDSQGVEVAEVKLLSGAGATLEVSTLEGLHLEKPSGWSSDKK